MASALMSMIYQLNLEIMKLTAIINVTPIRERGPLLIQLHQLENELLGLIHHQNNGGAYKKRVVKKKPIKKKPLKKKPVKKYY